MKPGDYAGVFSVDHSLHRLVPFTRDTTRSAPGSSWRSRARGPPPPACRARRRTRSSAGRRPRRRQAPRIPTPGAGQPGQYRGLHATAASATAASDQLFAAELQSIDDFDRYASKEIQATAVSDSLRGLVQLLAPLPGRKTVVLFSEGLQVTNSTVERWGHLHRRGQPPERLVLHVRRAGPARAERSGCDGAPAGLEFRDGLLAWRIRRQHGAAQRDAARRDDARARGAGVEHRRPVHQQHQQPDGRLRAGQRGPPLVLHAVVLVDEPDARRQVPLDYRQGAAPGSDSCARAAGTSRRRQSSTPTPASTRPRRSRRSRNVRRRGRSRSSFRRSRRRCRAGRASSRWWRRCRQACCRSPRTPRRPVSGDRPRSWRS